jgi:hypothetical protein
MIDPTDFEKDCMAAALKPLGEYVAEIGMHRSFAEMTKHEVLTIIEVVVTAYQDRMRGSPEYASCEHLRAEANEKFSSEVPF